MTLRRHRVLLLVAALSSLAASFPTPNFVVEAPTAQIAQQVALAAEQYRKEKALLWLGQEMPPWPQPCPVRVKVTFGGAGGATSFVFDQGHVLGQRMEIEGALDRLLASVLPHEVTHTVFAHHFRMPVPRWADEGGSVLSEDDLEKSRHDQLVRQILNTPSRAIPLRRLFTLKDYPGDVMVLYAEGFSVSQFLVAQGGRPMFLKFVGQGMREGWDKAVVAHYRYRNVEDLEQAWLTHLRSTRRQPAELARNNQPAPVRPNPGSLWAQNTLPEADPGQRVMVRQTAPPVQPLAAAPVYRGQSEDQTILTTRPGYLPDITPVTPPSPPASPAPWNAPNGRRDPWQPAGTVPSAPPQPQSPFRLGVPEPVQQESSPTPLPKLPPPPIGYPR